MLNKLTTLLAVLTIISSGTANADLDIASYENYEAYAKNEIVELNKQQEPTVESMDVVLNEHIYEIQPEVSKIEFRVDSPIGEICASFQDFKGSFTMVNTGTHRKPAFIDVNTESLNTDGGLIGMMLRSESFFDVENFPSMHFVGSSFEWFDDRHAILKGVMTIKNVTRQVAFYVELDNDKVEKKDSQRITMSAKANIKRSEFDIHTMLPVVGDNVSLHVSINAIKKTTQMSVSMLH
jgi:polyisoprenoid-binding protein YceI